MKKNVEKTLKKKKVSKIKALNGLLLRSGEVNQIIFNYKVYLKIHRLLIDFGYEIRTS